MRLLPLPLLLLRALTQGHIAPHALVFFLHFCALVQDVVVESLHGIVKRLARLAAITKEQGSLCRREVRRNRLTRVTRVMHPGRVWTGSWGT